jgi:nicotinate-nucleotide pyrophosphorylase (carboxylating)
MSPVEAAACSQAIKDIDRRIVVEASGGITPFNAAQYAGAVDVISLGWLTHSVHAVDFSLDLSFKE